MPSPIRLAEALECALEFAEAEVEQREQAGGSMTDYIGEAQQVVDRVSAALSALREPDEATVEVVAAMTDPWAFETVEQIAADFLERTAALFVGRKPSKSYLAGIQEQAEQERERRAEHRQEGLKRARAILAALAGEKG